MLNMVILGEMPQQRVHDLIPAALVAVPRGGVLGAFYDDVGIVLGGVDAQDRLYPIQPLPTDELTLAVSPDGSRLYLGMDGAILECAVEPTGEAGRYSVQIESRLAVSGRVGPMSLDTRGERLLFVRPDDDAVAILQ